MLVAEIPNLDPTLPALVLIVVVAACSLFVWTRIVTEWRTGWPLADDSRRESPGLGLPRSVHELLDDLRLAALGFLAAALPVYSIQTVLTQVVRYEHPILEELLKKSDWQTWLSVAVSAVIAAPLREEIIFRLVLIGGPIAIARLLSRAAHRADPPPVEEGNGPAIPSRHEPIAFLVFVSALLFAAAHYGQGPAPVPLFFLGLLLGYIYGTTFRLLPCIFLHGLFNGFSLWILWLSI